MKKVSYFLTTLGLALVPASVSIGEDWPPVSQVCSIDAPIGPNAARFYGRGRESGIQRLI